MITIYDIAGQTEYKYINGIINLDAGGNEMKPVRGLVTSSGEDFKVYKGTKTDIKEMILSRVAKNNTAAESAPVIAADKVGFIGDAEFVAVLTETGEMIVTVSKGIPVIDLGEQAFKIEKNLPRLLLDDEKDAVKYVTVEEVISSVDTAYSGKGITSGEKDFEYFFSYKFAFEEGNLNVLSAHNFLGGTLISEKGEIKNIPLWSWYVLPEKGRREMLRSRVSKYHPSKEQEDQLVGISDIELVEQKLSDFNDASNRHVAEMLEKQKEEKEAKKQKAMKRSVRKKKTVEEPVAAAASDMDGAAAFLSALNVMAKQGE